MTLHESQINFIRQTMKYYIHDFTKEFRMVMEAQDFMDDRIAGEKWHTKEYISEQMDILEQVLDADEFEHIRGMV